MVLDDIITKLRDVYAVSSAEFSDDKLETLIDAARKKLSELYPANELSSVLTVSGQTRYLVVHDGLIKLKEVYYPKSGESSLFGNEIPTNLNVSVGNLSQNYEIIARLKLLSEVYPFEGRIVDHNHFDLLPTPETAGQKIWYEYLRYRTLAELPDMFEEDLIELVFFTIKDRVFKKNSMTGGDGFMFDRRGNVKVDAETVDGNKAHKQIETEIIRRIKAKVMTL